MGSSGHQKGSIQWFLAQGPSQTEQQDPNTRPFKQPRLKATVAQTCRPHLALRSSNHCQQLLARQLGWQSPPSLNTWYQAQQQQLSCIWPGATRNPHGFSAPGMNWAISCIEVHQLPIASNSNGHALVALGEASGKVHICRLSRLQAASATALNAASALPADTREALLDPHRWFQRLISAEGVPTGSGPIPTAAAAADASGAGVLTFDTQHQLRSCCWLQQHNSSTTGGSSSREGVLITSGPAGLVKRELAEGRHASSSLRAKGGSKVEAAGTVVALDADAAYQLAAVSGKSLLLWDLRASPGAAAALPLQAPPTVLRAMPGGQVLLTAEANGQVCLYDVRRLSSSSIINFGSSRASQQLLLTHNLKTRAQAAGFSSGSSSSRELYGSTLAAQFISDVILNPADPNLLAYIKPDFQAGLFDLHSGQVLQQLSLLLEQNSTPCTATSSANKQPTALRSMAAGAQGCWDCTGRVLYAQGLLQCSQSDVLPMYQEEASPSLAAVDFGSWHGRRQRWGGNTPGSSSNSSSGGGGSSANQAAALGAAGAERGQSEEAAELGSSIGQDSSRGRYRWQGQAHIGQGGQVLHRELHCSATPTAIAAAGSCGTMLVGTQTGNVLWLE